MSTLDALTARDRDQLEGHGLAAEEVERQLALLRHPPQPVRLLRPCTLGDGVRRLDEQDTVDLERRWQDAARAGRLSKMVPASGAASRMFSDLESVRAGTERVSERQAFDTVRRRLADLGFHHQLEAVAGGAAALANLETGRFLELLLTPSGLDLAARPKALIPFHRDPSRPTGGRTAVEEHLLESRGYLRDGDGRCRLHLTVSAKHERAIKAYLAADENRSLRDENVTYEVSFSTQAPSTDTIAISPDDSLFRTEGGELLLRPGGHGALIDNLERTSGDIVVIKNIDNVVPLPRHTAVAQVMRRLIGFTLLLESRLARARAGLAEDNLDGSGTDEAIRILADLLGSGEAREILSRSPDAKRAFAQDRLDRPLRVCGVVRNTGEPGGGPFWICENEGKVSAQIIEGAQVDLGNDEQRAILKRATHFNPVLLVCSLRDPEGKPYDLRRYVDPQRIFVAEKTADGRPLRALEHPGLWNGAMAHWNTLFVEVPDVVFAPVKSVLDLLRPEHQPG